MYSVRRSSPVLFAGGLAAWTNDRLWYRRTAMPLEARPSAMSMKGLFLYIVSSKSCGPEPLIRMTAGVFIVFLGIVIRPSSSCPSSALMTTASSVNRLVEMGAYGLDVLVRAGFSSGG